MLLCRHPDAAQRGPVGALAEGGRSTEKLRALHNGAEQDGQDATNAGVSGAD